MRGTVRRQARRIRTISNCCGPFSLGYWTRYSQNSSSTTYAAAVPDNYAADLSLKSRWCSWCSECQQAGVSVLSNGQLSLTR